MGRFASTMLDEMVRDLGSTCPGRAGLPRDTPALLSLVVDTTDTGRVMLALSLDWVDSAGRALDRMTLAFYPSYDAGTCRHDALALGRMWGVPVRGAHTRQNWVDVDGDWEPWI